MYPHTNIRVTGVPGEKREERTEKILEEIMPFTIAQKRIKYLRIRREVQSLYTKNYKTLLNEIET